MMLRYSSIASEASVRAYPCQWPGSSLICFDSQWLTNATEVVDYDPVDLEIAVSIRTELTQTAICTLYHAAGCIGRSGSLGEKLLCSS